MGNRIVITGASGFIGSSLLNQFARINLEAIGYSRRIQKDLITVGNYFDLPPNPDSVLVHLAQPRDTNAPSNGEEISLCENLFMKPWKHVVYISTSIVYGDKINTPRTTDEEVFGISEYTKVKLACEKIALGVDGTCLRLANIYGYGMGTNTVISDIIRQIPGEGQLVVRDGSPIRDFLWVDDAASCIAAATQVKSGGIFNLGSGEGIEILSLAKLALQLAGEENREIFSTSKSNKSSCLMLSISKTKTIFNWEPKINLTQGISSLLKRKLNNE